MGKTQRATLNALVEEAADWLQAWVPADWFECYSRRVAQWRLPGAKQKQEQMTQQIGQDGSHLLSILWSEQAPADVRFLPAGEGLRRTWVQQFFWEQEHTCVSKKDDLPPAHLTLRSPYDHKLIMVTNATFPGMGTKFT